MERFRVLFFHQKNHLIADEVQPLGKVDHTPVYRRPEPLSRMVAPYAAAEVQVAAGRRLCSSHTG